MSRVFRRDDHTTLAVMGVELCHSCARLVRLGEVGGLTSPRPWVSVISDGTPLAAFVGYQCSPHLSPLY